MSVKSRERDAPRSSGRVPWLSGPVADLTIGCAAWTVPLVVLAALLSGRSDGAHRIVLQVLAVAVVFPHYAATLRRAYGTRQEFRKHVRVARDATIALIFVGVAAHLWHPLLPHLFTVVATWSAWHLATQNFGIALLFVRRLGLDDGPSARRRMKAAFLAPLGCGLVALHSGVSTEPYVLSLEIPASFATLACATLAVASLGLAAWAFVPLVSRASLRPLVAPLTIFATQLLWFVVPSLTGAGFGVPLRTLYASGLLLVLHSAQQLWLSAYYARTESATRPDATPWHGWRFAGALLTGGVLLFLPGPWVVSRLFGHDIVASIVAFTAVINVHHFLLERRLWRLRDPDVRAVLVERGSGGLPAAETRWSRLSPPVRRVVAVVAVAVALAFATLEVARVALGANRANLELLALALRLAPNDTAAMTSLGRTLAASGRTDEAVSTLERAVALDPYNTITQRALARTFLEANRFEDAYRHNARMLEYVPPDVDLLVNAGLVAIRLDRIDEAIAFWRRAVELDPDEPDVRLYLANAYTVQNKTREAMPHYEQYLVSAARDEYAPVIDPRQVLVVTLKLGDGYVELGDNANAGEYLRKLESMAVQAGDARFEAAAVARLAPIYAATEDLASAVTCYKRAIAIDRKLGDAEAEAIDWLNYARFFKDTGAAPQLTVACLLNARDGLAATPGPDRDTAERALSEARDLFGASLVDGVAADREHFSAAVLSYEPPAKAR
jgi:tetratricopeptide (TPR) repeat protein